MGWVVGEGAHILGADIEQMGGIARRISEADAKVVALLDQCHPGCSSGLSEKVYSQQDAASEYYKFLNSVDKINITKYYTNIT